MEDVTCFKVLCRNTPVQTEECKNKAPFSSSDRPNSTETQTDNFQITILQLYSFMLLDGTLRRCELQEALMIVVLLVVGCG